MNKRKLDKRKEVLTAADQVLASQDAEIKNLRRTLNEVPGCRATSCPAVVAVTRRATCEGGVPLSNALRVAGRASGHCSESDL